MIFEKIHLFSFRLLPKTSRFRIISTHNQHIYMVTSAKFKIIIGHGQLDPLKLAKVTNTTCHMLRFLGNLHCNIEIVKSGNNIIA